MAILQPAKVLIIFLYIFAAAEASPPAFPAMDLDTLHKLLSASISQRKLQGEEFSSQVIVTVSNMFKCLAALANVNGQQIGITSATCIGPQYSEDQEITLYSLPNEIGSTYQQQRRVVKAVIHEDYGSLNPVTPTNNIVLLFIEKPFEINNDVQPISLPSEEPQGVLTTVGAAPNSEVLQTLELRRCNDEFCKLAWNYHPFEFISGEMFCGNKTSTWEYPFCHYDGFIVENGNGELAGFVGNPFVTCIPLLYPPTYINVFHFVAWINDKVAENANMPMGY